MLRKRTRSHMGFESHFQSDAMCKIKTTNNPFFTVPGLFVGLCPKGLSDCDSVRSPTSPLDIRVFSNPAAPKKWDTTKVGLSIIDSLNDDVKETGKILRSSESKNILFGPQMRIKPPNSDFEASKSLPFEIFRRAQIKTTPMNKGDVVFEIGDAVPEPFGKTRSSSLADINPNSNSGNFCFENLTTRLDSPPVLLGGNPDSYDLSQSKLNSTVGSGLGSFDSLSASEIELSEDYTCVISHGPNPKTIHIFGDSILECHSNFDKKEVGLPQSAALYPSADFLNVCYSCNKKLEGKDIYIYRGEKSFCSLKCRSEEISIDEEMEKSDSVP